MARGTLRGRMDEALGKLTELEGRLVKLQGELAVLRGQARQARGKARVRLARLEKRAAHRVAGVETALRTSKDRIGEALEASRRRVEKLMRSVEPAVRHSLDAARELRVRARAAGRLSRGLRKGIKAGREAFRHPRRG